MNICYISQLLRIYGEFMYAGKEAFPLLFYTDGVDPMQWNISAEFVSAIVTLVIFVYCGGSNAVPTPRNKTFRLCMGVTFLAVVLDILSAISIEQAAYLPLWVPQTLTNLYFLITPLIPVIGITYILMLIYEKSPNRAVYKFCMWAVWILFGVNTVLVGANVFIGCLFFFDSGLNYVRGALNSWPFVLAYICMALGVVSCLFERKYLERATVRVLVLVVLIASVLLCAQQFYTNFILSGTAATISILVLYLSFQNKRIVTDPLTGLANRETFSKLAAYLLRKKEPMQIALISLDDFKFVNSEFGQHFGNQLLRSIAQFLLTVLPERYVYRYGGDEFIVVLHGKYLAKVESCLEQIHTRFQSPWHINSFHYRIHATIAALRAPEQAAELEEIVGLLEYAVKTSKRKKKGQLVFCDESLLLAYERRKKVLHAVQHAMENNGFEVYYQPIHKISDGSVKSAEALLRLHDDELGLISPGEFIPVAEEAGLITEIGFLALDMVCKAIRYLDTHNIGLESISTNYSTQQFSYEYIANQTMNIIHSNGVDPSRVKIEITERLLAEHLDDASKLMQGLNKQGVKFFLDDFGVGYSNLMYVVKLPLECIKFDKGLIRDIIGKENLYSLIASLSKGFALNGAYVVAEGVETVEQAKLLKKLSCDYAQGYLYSKPMPFEQFVRFLIRDSKRDKTKKGKKTEKKKKPEEKAMPSPKDKAFEPKQSGKTKGKKKPKEAKKAKPLIADK